MIDGLGNSTSILQVKRAEQAFKTASKYKTEQVSDSSDDSASEVSLNSDYNLSTNSSVNQSESDDILSQKSQMISDFKDFINKNGISDISDNDISYALKYGRSILVDQSA